MSDKILEAAKQSKRLALGMETKFADSRSNAPSPADFGDHEEIPDDAVSLVPVVISVKDIQEKS